MRGERQDRGERERERGREREGERERGRQGERKDSRLRERQRGVYRRTRGLSSCGLQVKDHTVETNTGSDFSSGFPQCSQSGPTHVPSCLTSFTGAFCWALAGRGGNCPGATFKTQNRHAVRNGFLFPGYIQHTHYRLKSSECGGADMHGSDNNNNNNVFYSVFSFSSYSKTLSKRGGGGGIHSASIDTQKDN